MNKRILILDDDLSNAEALTMIMEQEGFIAHHLQYADTLFPLIEEFKPDILFLDIHLGEKDGRLICNQVKANQKTEKIPVVLISAMLPNQIKDVPSSEDGIINKPFDIDEVIEMVNRLIKN